MAGRLFLDYAGAMGFCRYCATLHTMQKNNKLTQLPGIMVFLVVLAGCGGAGGTDPAARNESQDAVKETIDTVNKPPVVTIAAPSDGLVLSEGDSVTFVGTAVDAEEGDLTDNLEWASDQDGVLGVGSEAVVVLTAGTHIITADITDSGRLSADNKITVTITPDESPPSSLNNAGSLAGEGRADIIDSAELSFVDNVQPISSIVYSVTRDPAHGQLALTLAPDTKVQTFSQLDIDAGRLVYLHERGNGASDEFEFNVEDGRGNVLAGQTFAIRIVANVSDLDIDYDGHVTMTWVTPPGGYVNGIEIRRRNDGQYPQDPTDGVLVWQLPASQQSAAELFLPSGGLGQTAYYSIFSYGEGGIYSDGVRAGVYCDGGDCVTVPDLRDLTNTKTVNDVETRRRTLINAIWGIDTLPTQLPVSVMDLDPPANPDSTASRDWRPVNAIRTEQMLVDPGDAFFVDDFELRLYSPAVPNGRLVIYHGGHRGIPDTRKNVIERFLFEGYSVLEMSMPMAGYNFNQIYHPPVGTYHEGLTVLDRPMRFFFEQVTVAVNYLTLVRGFSDIYMVGISGGGWTTVVYAALDPRITASYPVAGSNPFYLNEQLGFGSDFEQANPDFYQYASYLELYLLGSAGRRQLQVFNVFDDCCFAGTYSNTFKGYIQVEAERIGGSFDISLDDTFVGHMISDYAIEIIVSDIAVH